MYVLSTRLCRHPLPIVRLCIFHPLPTTPAGPARRIRIPAITKCTQRAAHPRTSLAQARSPYAAPAESPPVSILTHTRALDAQWRRVFERSSPHTTDYIHIPISSPARGFAIHLPHHTCHLPAEVRAHSATPESPEAHRRYGLGDLALAACMHSRCDTCIPILVPRCPTVPSVHRSASSIVSSQRDGPASLPDVCISTPTLAPWTRHCDLHAPPIPPRIPLPPLRRLIPRECMSTMERRPEWTRKGVGRREEGEGQAGTRRRWTGG
ncbi:hypothetical protein GGX14DRAFT_648299 [Mycena pura]|uniref:Uncharacterized protein n=1 Tax=Mycena pura TaxID=153505 RepID=A0AAD6YMK2_9AGAR|nr:hypothetical protein GGX14DRAFT_648299 [Mycena pura]